MRTGGGEGRGPILAHIQESLLKPNGPGAVSAAITVAWGVQVHGSIYFMVEPPGS